MTEDMWEAELLESGATKRVANLISDTGIKDSLSMPLINALVDLGKSLRRGKKGQKIPETAAQAILQKEFDRLRSTDNTNVLLDMPGECHLIPNPARQ